MTAPSIQKGRYLINIDEFEHEHTEFDQVKLLAIDHSLATDINVLPDGEIIEYETPFKLKSVEGDTSQNTVAKLSSFDHIALNENKGNPLLLHFVQTNNNDTLIQNSQEGGIILAGWPDQGTTLGKSLPPKESSVGLVGGLKTPSSPSYFTFRERPSLIYVPLSKLQLDLNIIFTRAVALDYAQLAVKVSNNYKIYELPLLAAQHSEFGNILSKLTAQDGDNATLEPNESIRLEFGTAPIASGMTRSFIVVANGYYYTLQGTESYSIEA